MHNEHKAVITFTLVSGTDPPLECPFTLTSVRDFVSIGGVSGLAVTYDGVETLEFVVFVELL